MGELGLCDVTDQTAMSRSGLNRAAAVVGANFQDRGSTGNNTQFRGTREFSDLFMRKLRWSLGTESAQSAEDSRKSPAPAIFMVCSGVEAYDSGSRR